MLPGISSLRLELRPITADDAPLLFELDSDPEVMRWLSGGPATPLETIRDQVLPGFLALPAERGFGSWLVFERETGDFLGWVSLRPGPALEDGGELGYRFRRTAWGRGIATEAAGDVLAHAFEVARLPRVFGTTYEQNHGSLRVMEKLGMAVVRRFRPTPAELAAQSTFAPGESEPWDGDDLEYAIERADWTRSHHVPGWRD
jgi:RimJ/RimL family protein N-acetyltransferase